ncbi:MAG: ROK family transcriptional regulator [Sporolactobacillus sp.]
MQIGSTDLIRTINRRLILDLVRCHQPISRAEIARNLSLSRSTVSMIVTGLIEEGYVIERGTGQSTINGGRKGTLLGFNPRAAFAIGLDLQGPESRIVLADFDGEIIRSDVFQFSGDTLEISNVIDDFLRNSEEAANKLLGVGISVPSIVKDHQIVVDAPSLGWQNLNLVRALDGHRGWEVFVINDVNAAAMGECNGDSGERFDNLFYFSIGTGVGSAIIANGELVLGADQAAGEIGYFLESSDVEKQDVYAIGRFGTNERKLTELIKRANQSIDARDQLVTELAVMIANICSLLNPEKVIIGGSFERVLRPLIPKLQTLVKRLSPLSTEVIYSDLGEQASVKGAVSGMLRYLSDRQIR